MDLIGPISPPSNSGHCYILTIINQLTSFKITSFLKNKSDAYKEFVKQQKLLENTHNQKIKQLVTDGGGEFVNQQFKDLANQHGFTHVIAPPYTPEHNGIAERENRAILDKAQCLILTSNLPNQYLEDQIFCYLSHQHITYTFEQKLITLLLMENPISKDQKDPYLWLKVREENILPFYCHPTALLSETDPLTFNQEIKSKDHEHWSRAITKELQKMTNLNVWEEVSVKEDFKLIGTTWVFKTKRNELNQIVEHKARLCAQGFSQTQGKDYSKTFAPTGRLNSLRTLISYSAASNLKFEQLDIKSAFLNAPLEENVYLTILQGLDRDKKNTCLKLKRAMYGLKQAPLVWYRHLSSWLVNFGFSISKADTCVFYLKSNEPIWLFLHVDDIGIFGRNLTNFKNTIEQEFQTKLLVSADLMLGIKLFNNQTLSL
ncbi:hypothetical protein O181_088882 [Austropuccinia psidii MF-1]|uniref:Integrase catalytic domain-containing protein n=1 Tax=Austropuccinia psidii MF-1 TaxID=1389203 RepID=A0A9Q3ISI4_9BASI|nr:hypothetical protein [Austropuccinia psidii MF-1]